MNDRPMLVIMAVIQLLFGIYMLRFPGRAREANRTPRFAFAGWGNKPLWFFQLIGFLCLLGSVAFVYTALTSPSN